MQEESFPSVQLYYYNINGGKIVEKSSSSSAMEGSYGGVKGLWTPEEDRMLIRLVKQYGLRKWSQIARKFVGRIGKQCRERWHNHLRPDIKKDSWTEEEESMLVQAHKEIGNKWAEIAKRIPGRTENSIKNHWNATKRKQSSKRKLRRKAIHGDATKLTAFQEYIKSKTLNLPEITPITTSPSTSHSSTSNEFQMMFAQPPQPDDSELPSQMVDELLFMEKPEIRWFEKEEQDLMGCSDMEYVSQFLNMEEESFPSSSNVTSAGFEAQIGSGSGSGGEKCGSHLQWDFYLSNLLSGPSLPAIDEIGSYNANKVTCSDGQPSPIRSGDMDLMEILNWHLSHLPIYNKNFGEY